MKKEVYEQLKTYKRGTPIEVNYTFRYGAGEFSGSINGFFDEVDEKILILTTNEEDNSKDVLSLERIVSVKRTHATTEELAGHVT